ncbi:MAG TPA: DedA family protein [Longimicrobiales bacterium]
MPSWPICSCDPRPGGPIEDLLYTLADLPPILIYLLIGVGAAVENIIPPVPADTFVVLGAFLAAIGRANPWVVFLFTWVPNVGSALLVYFLARKYGRRFFQTPFGRWLLHPKQMEQVHRFYDRWGVPAIALSRFLPAFRALVPVFAGTSHLSFLRVAPPVILASGIWYGALVYLGYAAGRELEWILALVDRVGDVLLWIALVLLVLVLIWWWLTRAHRREEH